MRCTVENACIFELLFVRKLKGGFGFTSYVVKNKTMKKEPIYGEDLATEIILKLRRNEFKTMSDEQIEKFRLAMAYYLDFKNL
jgi:hypothetical protein